MEIKAHRFGLIGAAGFVAPRHMRALRETGQELIAAYDPYDGVGVIDEYFPDAHFFTEFERFDRHLDKRKRRGEAIDFLSICSPNYLHDSHIRFGLRSGAHVICEKPLVLNPWNLDALEAMEQESERKVFSILQLRYHPAIQQLRETIQQQPPQHRFRVKLTYLTARGRWYYASWKAEESKSGGVATNLGIHFFDVLQYLFGQVKSSTLHLRSHDRAAGVLDLPRAEVQWFLSTDWRTLPQEVSAQGQRTFRAMEVDGKTVDFSQGFNNLHTISYREILQGGGFGLEENRPAITLCHQIRHQAVQAPDESCHPLVNLPTTQHPFNQ